MVTIGVYAVVPDKKCRRETGGLRPRETFRKGDIGGSIGLRKMRLVRQLLVVPNDDSGKDHYPVGYVALIGTGMPNARRGAETLCVGSVGQIPTDLCFVRRNSARKTGNIRLRQVRRRVKAGEMTTDKASRHGRLAPRQVAKNRRKRVRHGIKHYGGTLKSYQQQRCWRFGSCRRKGHSV